jgi:hypothetical protein
MFNTGEGGGGTDSTGVVGMGAGGPGGEGIIGVVGIVLKGAIVVSPTGVVGNPTVASAVALGTLATSIVSNMLSIAPADSTVTPPIKSAVSSSLRSKTSHLSERVRRAARRRFDTFVRQMIRLNAKLAPVVKTLIEFSQSENDELPTRESANENLVRCVGKITEPQERCQVF